MDRESSTFQDLRKWVEIFVKRVLARLAMSGIYVVPCTTGKIMQEIEDANRSGPVLKD